MSRVLILVAVVPALWAQSSLDLFDKAPPAVDQALRARIAQFYQYHVDGKFRQAEALVAEECKDFFYTSNKPKYMGFVIKSIDYSDEFTKAKATIVAKMVLLFPGFPTTPMPVPFPSHWKLVNGDWFWYVDLDKLNETPFGKARPGPTSGGPPPAGPPQASGPSIESLWNLVKAEPAAIQLKAEKNAVQPVSITNHMPGGVSLNLEGILPAGLIARLESTAVKAGEKATLTLQWKEGSPIPATPVVVHVRVQPTNQLIPVQVTILQPK